MREKEHSISILLSPSHRKQPNTPDTNEAPLATICKCLMYCKGSCDPQRAGATACEERRKKEEKNDVRRSLISNWFNVANTWWQTISRSRRTFLTDEFWHSFIMVKAAIC